MSTPDVERLRSIKTFPSLVKYLRDELDWPIESDDFDELTFDYEPEELGLDAKTAVKIKEIKQLRPLASNQPWGIFFVNFEPKRLPVVVLRRILRSLILKKRQSANKPQQAAWQLHDLLFISAYGESEHRDITLANFSDDSEVGDLPTLKVLGWDDEDTVLHLAHAHDVLKEKLHWPEDPADLDNWRRTWSQAFTLRHRQVIGTSKALAERMAELATAIRKRVNAVLKVESDKGPLRKLMTAFREALIHDLTEDDFADMYAQTITYGLLSARVSRPAGLVAENVTDMVPPVTNPFLHDLLSQFLAVGGRKGKVDFDELGINEVVHALRDADMEAVLRDFDDKNPQEDPVIHFYELFLKEYDPKKRMQRGVFFTPRPVVSFIVRSVDEILRKEFGLADGLADTTTWGEMAKRHPEIKIPDGAKPEDPFVQILDPACGTATFLVEVIDVIHQTMKAKWRKQGHMALEFQNLWNDYVADHLLPRLYGFELMMAPYAIAHMKVGLKLGGTGYRFGSHERARVYLTNTLEEPKDFSDHFEFDAPALAHEAHAVNAVKRNTPFTVVIGNPPYSVLSANLSVEARRLVDPYRFVDGRAIRERSMLRLEMHLQDDYVKFFRYSQRTLERTSVGVFSFISNNGYLDNLTLRGMRFSLAEFFRQIAILNLHGGRQKSTPETRRADDQNVFDIEQGVAIFIGGRSSVQLTKSNVCYGDLIGPRELKYRALLGPTSVSICQHTLLPKPENYFLVPKDTTFAAEFEAGNSLTEILPNYISGIVTAHDDLVIDFEAAPLREKAALLRDTSLSDDAIKARLNIKDNAGWKVSKARRELRSTKDSPDWYKEVSYRPFDNRHINYHPALVWCDRRRLMKNMLSGENIALSTCRQLIASPWQHVLVSRHLQDDCYISNKSRERSYLFPLFVISHGDEHSHSRQSKLLDGHKEPNLSLEAVRRLAPWPPSVEPPAILHFVYAVLHSPTYRSRYDESLKTDFPRIPTPAEKALFDRLLEMGSDLVALHLLEDDYPAASWNVSKPKGKSPLQNLITKFGGKGDSEVAKGYPKFILERGSEAATLDCGSDATALDEGKKGDGSAIALQSAAARRGRVCINHTRYFEGVPENVWKFHIGGYQVCEKWLKDRRGRVLSEEDIAHYQKIVVALKETIRLMAEIDKVIEAHGGWPGAFLTPTKQGQG